MQTPSSSSRLLELSVSGIPDPFKEIILAELAESGFYGFIEEESLLGYVSVQSWDEQVMLSMLQRYGLRAKVSWTVHRLTEKNWNESWERSYEPVIISGKCMVRAPFHEPALGIEYDLIIEPKMAFGTAHHETTVMMIELMLHESLSGMMVLDMGCGTGVLAILASKMGAAVVYAVDVDEWAINNTRDNLVKNNTPEIIVIQGGTGMIPPFSFDLILANINRNVLMADIPVYCTSLAPDGKLMMSGFLTEDLEKIISRTEEYGKKIIKHQEKNHWQAVVFQ